MPRLRRPPPAQPGEVNYDFFDRFTFVHFGIGVAYGVLDLPVAAVAFLAVAWEIVEDILKAYAPILFPHATADTWKNSVGDIAAVCLGFGVVGWGLPH